MAKISARGHRETARWEGEDGATLVLTAHPAGRGRSRLLRKYRREGGYTVLRTGATEDEAAALAGTLGLGRAAVRR